MAHPAEFPPLPQIPENFHWSPDVLKAYSIIAVGYDRASALLRQEETEPLRLRIHSEEIINKFVPILQALEPEIGDQEWLEGCAHALGAMTVALQRGAATADGIETAKLKCVAPVHMVKTGQKGRPRKVVDPVWLADAVSGHRNVSLQDIANGLGMHRNTLRNYLKAYGVYERYSKISAHDLDILVKKFKEGKPNSGLRYLVSFLRTHGLRVQKERVRQSLRRVDRLGQVLRKQKIIRRQYYSPRPNSVWHMDGHHKLINWGIVIHGFVDGYDRTVTGLRASSNNRAGTVLRLFLRAVEMYGTPSRCRGDRGGENIEVSVWMIKYRGPNRGSFLWGTSTRNTRVERLWVEVGSQFARRWRGFFLRLERLHRLNRDNPYHLWLLHYLFLDEINNDCEEFRNQWNHHPIAGKAGNDKSPTDMRLLGELRYGKYADVFPEDVHPEVLENYGQSNDLDGAIANDQDHHIRHEAIDVTETKCPFRSEDGRNAFVAAFQEVQEAEIIPENLGVAEDEWEGVFYSETETVKVGRKQVEIQLPFVIWWPRAVAWAQALEVMVRIQAMEDS